jgi:spermidine synthase
MAALLSTFGSRNMADSSQNWLHENFEHTGSAFGLRIVRKLEEVQSPFQKIEMYESSDWGNVMLIDGAMMVTTRDNFFYHEMMAHAPLFTHGDPKDVVIIGGGDCGTLREVLKHAGVRRAVQCDIDEQVTRMSRSTSRSCASPTPTRARR